MAQQGTSGEPPERRYDETVAPSNPPNSLLRPQYGRAALSTYVGVIVALCVIVGAMLLFRAANDDGRDEARDPAAIGTSGDRTLRGQTPGGFDPAPIPGSTAEEIERRGGGELRQAPSPGPGAPSTVTSLGAIRSASPQSINGWRVELEGVRVERADGGTFWIRDGDTTMTVVTPGDSPTVKAGQEVDLTGTLESADGGGVRIRASRIAVK